MRSFEELVRRYQVPLRHFLQRWSRGDELDDAPLRPGEQRAWMVASLLREHRIVLAGAGDPGALAGLGLDLAEDPVTAALGVGGRLLVVPDALHVLPGR